MPTSGAYAAPVVPECSYAPRMTRAQALALRTAGTLRENCVVVVTDGPAVGPTATATEIELNPVSSTAFGQTARVFTAYDNDAWAGLYDIDLGTGTITELRDNRGNVVRDSGDGATVVAFPWGTANVTDNEVTDSALTGWSSMTGLVNNNIIRRANVDLTGNWTEFVGNFIQSALTAPASFPTVVLNGGTGTRVFNGNTVRDGSVFRSNTGSTGARTITDSEFLDGYVFDIAAASTAVVTVDGSRFEGHGATALDAQVTGAGTRVFNNARSVTTSAAAQYVLGGAGGTVTVEASDVTGGRITRDSAATSPLTVQGGTRLSATLDQGPGALGGTGTVVTGSLLQHSGTALAQLGAGSLNVAQSSFAGGSATIAATATRGLDVQASLVQGGNIQQNRTGGTGVDTVTGAHIEGTSNVVTLAGATNPGGNQTVVMSSRVAAGGTLALTDPAGSGGTVIQQSDITAGATVTGTSTGLVRGCRFSARATVALGAFSHDSTVIDGLFTRTLNAANTNRLLNKSFDDVLGV